MGQLSAPTDLLSTVLAGDRCAFTDLIKGSDRQMRSLAYRLLGSQAAMDDALQDAYLSAYRSLGDYDGRAAFGSWLYTIVYRTCLNHLRQMKRRGEVALDSVAEPASATSGHGETHADADALERALRQLPPDQAAAVLLVDGEGCTYAEASEVLGVREGTIASRLNRAHHALRTILTVQTEEGSPP